MLNLVYHWASRGYDEDQRARLDELLTGADPVIEVAATVTAPPAQARHVPGLAPPNMRAPSWWRGDRAAWSNTIKAGLELGEPAAKNAGRV
jgi:hypothetical protein